MAFRRVSFMITMIRCCVRCFFFFFSLDFPFRKNSILYHWTIENSHWTIVKMINLHRKYNEFDKRKTFFRLMKTHTNQKKKKRNEIKMRWYYVDKTEKCTASLVQKMNRRMLLFENAKHWYFCCMFFHLSFSPSALPFFTHFRASLPLLLLFFSNFSIIPYSLAFFYFSFHSLFLALCLFGVFLFRHLGRKLCIYKTHRKCVASRRQRAREREKESKRENVDVFVFVFVCLQEYTQNGLKTARNLYTYFKGSSWKCHCIGVHIWECIFESVRWLRASQHRAY